MSIEADFAKVRGFIEHEREMRECCTDLPDYMCAPIHTEAALSRIEAALKLAHEQLALAKAAHGANARVRRRIRRGAEQVARIGKIQIHARAEIRQRAAGEKKRERQHASAKIREVNRPAILGGQSEIGHGIAGFELGGGRVKDDDMIGAILNHVGKKPDRLDP